MSYLGIIFATKFAKIRTSIVVLFQFDPYNVPFYISTNPTFEYKCLRIHKLIIKQLLIACVWNEHLSIQGLLFYYIFYHLKLKL
jgi:hypothetical protein